jgi:hypothetical protein
MASRRSGVEQALQFIQRREILSRPAARFA